MSETPALLPGLAGVVPRAERAHMKSGRASVGVGGKRAAAAVRRHRTQRDPSIVAR
jgi:hypothetical protein